MASHGRQLPWHCATGIVRKVLRITEESIVLHTSSGSDGSADQWCSLIGLRIFADRCKLEAHDVEVRIATDIEPRIKIIRYGACRLGVDVAVLAVLGWLVGIFLADELARSSRKLAEALCPLTVWWPQSSLGCSCCLEICGTLQG